MGHYLRAPAFQNVCIDPIHVDYRNLRSNQQINCCSYVYKKIGEGTKLRKLMAHSTARLGPLQKFMEGSEEHTMWKNLLRELPELAFDMAAMAGRGWNDTWPGDDEYRSEYLEDELPLEDQWESQILKARNIDEIRLAAKDGCVWSMIELDHLERKKPEVNREA